jgi:hypothetical protein
MASTLNADNGVVSGTSGLKSTADNSGVLQLQTNGTTAMSINTSQVVDFTNAFTVAGTTPISGAQGYIVGAFGIV